MCPSLGAVLAATLLRTPWCSRPTASERRLLAAARRSTIRFSGGRLAVFRWGSGPPILLVHGWGGHSGRLGSFVAPLVHAGYTAIAFDAPGHGESGGFSGSVWEAVEALRALHDRLGPCAALIAHSLGASAAAIALRSGLPVARAVFIAPPADLSTYAARFARHFAISPRMFDEMKRRLADGYGISWERLRIDTTLPSSPARLLIFHDAGDPRVPFRDGEAVARAWPGARLVRTHGLGHSRILRDPLVVSRATNFVTGWRSRPNAAWLPAAAAS
jgi:pimeloyl-ACP methyl ester carboxylesterase